MQLSNRPREPYFVFPDIPAYKELSFEKLTSANFAQLYLLFESDENPFTDTQFKHYDSAKEYANNLEQYGAYSTKHGGQDCLFLWNDEYAGILHLYDLSLETFAENNRRCWVGFATKPVLRKKGITKKVLRYFIKYIFKNYPLIRYVHSMTFKENLPAQGLLKAVGFREDDAERMSMVHVFYVRERE
ncbi:MAG: GNAT family N-acetyltransferase [Flavobacterium sp.]|nr:GNAT family N-acetyltransferase [Pedobacter sp.]